MSALTSSFSDSPSPRPPIPASPRLPLTPQIAIVIPVYKHSVLAGEAIRCALEQETEFATAIVLVNDGCPFPETDRLCREFARAHPNRIVYLHRPNGGLSAARNTGIDFALATWPTVEAIYFLDADNRISRATLDRTFRVLLENPEEVGWVYPSIDMFGCDWNGDYGGDYSVLRHLRRNICEAGSLVRRAVFEAGCRYDESMKLGYEDWEFWWQAVEAGFRGRHLPEFGFGYRRRPESMVKNSDRDGEAILHYMRDKHPALFEPRTLLGWEQTEVPRYAIVLIDVGRVVLTTDPDLEEPEITFDEYQQHYHRARSIGARYHRPPFVAFLSRPVLRFLQRRRLVRSLFWHLEMALSGDKNPETIAHFAQLTIAPEASPGEMEVRVNTSTASDLTDHLLMVTVETLDDCLTDTTPEWLASLQTPDPLPQLYHLRLNVPRFTKGPIETGGAMEGLLQTVANLRKSLGKEKSWNWRAEHMPPRHRTFEDPRSILESKAIYPIVPPPSRRQLGLILPSSGESGEMALNLATLFKADGWQVHLFVFGDRLTKLPAWKDTVETINFYDDPMLELDRDSTYMGGSLKEWMVRPIKHRVGVGLLCWLDAIVNLGSDAAHGVMGLLRRSGVETLALVGEKPPQPWGRTDDYHALTLGYEHAYNLVIPVSESIARWCHGMGIPEAKLTTVPDFSGSQTDWVKANEGLFDRLDALMAKKEEPAQSAPSQQRQSAGGNTIKRAGKRKVTFLLSTGRCGSTLAQRLLNASPETVIWGEHEGFLRGVAQGYFEVCNSPNLKAAVFDRPGRFATHRVMDKEKIAQTNISWMNHFDRDVLKGSFRGQIESLFCDRLPEEITCWGFKEIRYGVDGDDRTIDMLLELFPESRNVVVTRHPWDTVVSMITAWNEDLVDRLLKNPSERGVTQLVNLAENYLSKWSEQNQILLDYVERFPDRFIRLRYEDFRTQFSDRVFDFMGVCCPENVKDVLDKKVWRTQDSPRSKCVKQNLDQVGDRLWEIVEGSATRLNYEP